jgi:NADH-quinone oxidoreductase subunit E
MLAIASQIILCLVLAALLGLIIGYLLGKANCPKEAYKTGAAHDPHTHDDGDCGDTEEAAEDDVAMEGIVDSAKSTAEADGADSDTATDAGSESVDEEADVPSDDDKPATLLDAPHEGEADNLKRIKGIGPKIESLLNEIGVYHFDQIAAWSAQEATWIDHKVSFPGRAMRDDWIGQAKLLAEGKETEFSQRVDNGEVASSKEA